MYLRRAIDRHLLDWKNDPFRKPLLLRGARQVGKSSAIRELARTFELFLEINFEEQRQVHSLFAGDLSPQTLAENLSVLYKTPVIPGKTLVFFDEIQACLPAISSLRFFYEKIPGLHLIAAGSLLEFALEELPSYGVGRVRTIFLYPFSFDEFLVALNEEVLVDAKRKATSENPLPDPIHRKLLSYLKRFLVLGGMPEVISRYSQTQDILSCQSILDDLLISLKSDFTKYKKRVSPARLSEVFLSVARQTGSKFIYTHASPGSNHSQIKDAVELLIMAGLVIPVIHSSANGLPLGAERNDKKRKLLLLDTGIFQRLLDLEISDMLFEGSFSQINKGAIAEMFVGLEIMKSSLPSFQKDLFYWQREALNSQAEVDYLIQMDQQIIPIEVKSGTRGAMQSLFLFLTEKKAPYGIRFSLENYSTYEKIRIFPLYAVTDVIRNP